MDLPGPVTRISPPVNRTLPHKRVTPTTLKPPVFISAVRRRADRDYVPTDVWDEQD